MTQIEFEQQGRQDLETALEMVRNNIQADCRVLSVETNDFSEFSQIAVDVSVGENGGLSEWVYETGSHRIPVTMVRCYFDCDLELYHEGSPDDINNFWTEVVNKLTEYFFTKNPEYQAALQS